VLDFLRCNTLNSLEENHGVCAKLSNDKTKVSLNYDMLTAKNEDNIASSCRGVVIKLSDDSCKRIKENPSSWQSINIDGYVINWPLNRFFNYGDPAAAQIDWSSSKVFEKLDGTMCSMYFDTNKWFVATRSISEADLPINDQDITFSDLFFKGLQNTFESLKLTLSYEEWMSNFDKEKTYVFELTSPYNQVVVFYPDTRVTLLAIRNSDGKEENIEKLSDMIPIPRSWNLRSTKEIIDYVNSNDPSKFEGVVVVDKNFNRLKIKHPSWNLLSRAKNNVCASKKNLIEAIVNNTIDDVIPLLDSETVNNINRIRAKLAKTLLEIDHLFHEFRAEAVSKKHFAELVLKSGVWTTPMFLMYDKKFTSSSEYIQSLLKDGCLPSGAAQNILRAVGEGT